MTNQLCQESVAGQLHLERQEKKEYAMNKRVTSIVLGMVHKKYNNFLGTNSLSREAIIGLSWVSNRTISTKEGNVLFNDALNTFYLRLYGVGYLDQFQVRKYIH